MDRAVLETASDRYVIVEYLAEGGMGAIYLGKKLGVDGFEKEVVLKQLLPELTSQPKFIDLFLREARLSASLDHANIVRTVDLVNAGTDYFMVMEYVRGGDLRTLMRRARRRRQRFSPQAAIFIGRELLEALAYAHGKSGGDGRPLGLIHRDVSPSNILVSGAGEVKLTDFGIAKASTHRSIFYKVKGKVGYMSPEQARAQTVDARSDLFSLGVVLYEVLVGERLFVGDLLSSAAQIYSQKIAPPSAKRPELPVELDQVIMKALSLDPALRFQSAGDFGDALLRVATQKRLLCGASEMASHLRQACGEDPSTWLKLETLGFDDSQAVSHGTAVLSSAGQDDDDPFDEPAQFARAPSVVDFPRRELTSVIALHVNDIEIIGEHSGPLPALEPRRSDPLDLAPTPPRILAERIRTPTPSGELTLVRLPGESAAGNFPPLVTATTTSELPALSFAPTTTSELPSPQNGAGDLPPPRPRGTSSAPRPVPSSSSSGRVLPAGSSAPRAVQRADEAPTRLSTKAAPGARPPETSTADVRATPRKPSPLWLLVILLILIGVGVAVGVAFSGPELEVVDPAPSAR